MWLRVQLYRGSDAAGKILESSPACTSTPQPPRPASTSTAKPSFPPLFFFNIIKGYFPPPVVLKMLGFPAPIWHDKHQMPRKHHQIPSNAHQMHHQMHQKIHRNGGENELPQCIPDGPPKTKQQFAPVCYRRVRMLLSFSLWQHRRRVM